MKTEVYSEMSARSEIPPPSKDEDASESLEQLLHRVLQISRDIYAVEAGSLTQRQLAVLEALDRHDGVSQIELVNATGIDRSTMAELMVRLEEKRLVRRERNPRDRRIKLIWLAEAGRVALSQVMPRARAADEKVLGLLAETERDRFVHLLHSMIAAAALVPAQPVIEPVSARYADAGDRFARLLARLPMPPLSEGATSEPDVTQTEPPPAPRWKPPKPLWKID